MQPCVWLRGRGGMEWDGPGSSVVWFGGGVEQGRPRREYSREMLGDSVPQNFTNGVRPRWGEWLAEMLDADRVTERSSAGRDRDAEKRREEARRTRRRIGERIHARRREEERRAARSSESRITTAWGSTGRRPQGRSGRPPPRGRARSRDPGRRPRVSSGNWRAGEHASEQWPRLGLDEG
jgi:hypothetical protein